MTTESRCQRVLHEQIDIKNIPAGLRKRVESHAGKEWDTTRDGIAEFRKWLLGEQRYRCVYCQVAIPAVSVGLCELDHILPKAISAHCDVTKVKGDDFESRQHTLGYSAFKFSVSNLAVSCKQCNASKKSFDPLANRSATPNTLPASYKDYEWVHPHFAKYSECISINENWLYSWLNLKGKYTIQACKLDRSEVLARRLASEALASQSKNLNHYLFSLTGRIDEIGHRDIVRSLCDRFDLTEETASKIVDLWNTTPREFSALERLAKETCALIGDAQLARKPKLGALATVD